MSEPLQEYQVGGSHYTDMGVQPWDAIKAVLSADEWIGYLKGNCIKYAMRCGHKKNTDDAAKFAHYSAKLLTERVRLANTKDSSHLEAGV